MTIQNLDVSQIFIGTSALAKGISQLKGHGRLWHKVSQQVAASAVIHAHTTGDVRPLQAALLAMPKGSKTNAMRHYFLAFAPVTWSETTKKFKFKSSRQVLELLTGADNDLLSAILQKHWSDMGKAENADNFKPYDIQARLLGIVKAANKALDGEHADKQKITAEDVNKLESMIRQLYPNVAV